MSKGENKTDVLHVCDGGRDSLDGPEPSCCMTSAGRVDKQLHVRAGRS